MQLQPGIFPARSDDFPRLVGVWEAAVRATHHFVSEADIDVFRPLFLLPLSLFLAPGIGLSGRYAPCLIWRAIWSTGTL